MKFESLCGLEVTSHTIAKVYFDKWKALSPFVHFSVDSNLYKFSAGTYLISTERKMPNIVRDTINICTNKL